MAASRSWLLGLIVALLCTGSFGDSVQAEERLQSEEAEVLRGLDHTSKEQRCSLLLYLFPLSTAVSVSNVPFYGLPPQDCSYCYVCPVICETVCQPVECELKAGAVGVRGGGLKHSYTVLQFHFHWGGKNLMHHPGSEHSLNGHRSPLEMHIVSRRSDLNDSTAAKVQDGFAVMGFFIEGNKKEKEKEKKTSQVWESFTDYLQKIPRKGDKVRIMEPFSMHQLLKGVDLSNGSLTTPPCDEAVVWTIFKDPIRISRDLLLRFPTKIYFDNVFRPQQPLNNRVVYSSAALTAGPAGTAEHVLQPLTIQGP